MVDVFLFYPVVWILFMGMGVLGYGLIYMLSNKKKSPFGYFLFQLLAVAVVLAALRDTFGATEPAVWWLYAVGFASYIAAFVVGAAVKRVEGVVSMQIMAFFVTYLMLPWVFCFTSG